VSDLPIPSEAQIFQELEVSLVSNTPAEKVASIVEKTVVTYVQAVIVAMLMAGTFDLSRWQAFAVAAFPAALSAFGASLPEVPSALPFYLDVLLRTVRTFVVSLIGLAVAMPVFSLDVAAWKPLAASAGISALAVLKGALAGRFGNRDSAALLPAGLDGSIFALDEIPAAV
jgi:hypothetical protein